jgi:hypothetical protein
MGNEWTEYRGSKYNYLRVMLEITGGWSKQETLAKGN